VTRRYQVSRHTWQRRPARADARSYRFRLGNGGIHHRFPDPRIASCGHLTRRLADRTKDSINLAEIGGPGVVHTRRCGMNHGLLDLAIDESDDERAQPVYPRTSALQEIPRPLLGARRVAFSSCRGRKQPPNTPPFIRCSYGPCYVPPAEVLIESPLANVEDRVDAGASRFEREALCLSLRSSGPSRAVD
jgi:hypothetical protein